MIELDRWRKALVQQLESLQRAGVTHLPRVHEAAPSSQPSKSSPSSQWASPQALPASRATPTVGSARNPETPQPGPPPRAGNVPPAPASPVVPAAVVPADGERAPVTRPSSWRAPGRLADDASPLLSGPALPTGSPLTLAQRQEAFTVLAAEVARCRKCPVLVANRTQTVFGVGNLQPRLCFFGEAPGADEDEQGEPFVGASGQLLNKMIAAMTLRREDVYILNVLKCRPPGNRTPLPDEAEKCRPFFERQLEILAPEFICCLGATAAQTLLKSKFSIGKLRGTFHRYGSAKVIATYHPSYVLRNPAQNKRPVWEDLQKLMAEMGLKRPS